MRAASGCAGCSLLVGPKEGGALELGELRVAFTVKVSEQETPNSASIRVYNLSEATAGRIRKEFTRVILQAGYQGNCSVIFDGNITKVALGQEGGPGAGKNGGEGEGVDTCLEISAGDGDRAYNYALVNTSLAAGSTPDDHVRACMKAFSAKGIEPGYIPLLPGQKLPRGKVMYGMARAYMRDTARRTGTAWSFPEGQDADGARQRLPPRRGRGAFRRNRAHRHAQGQRQGHRDQVPAQPSPAHRRARPARQRGRGRLKAGAGREPRDVHDGLYRILSITFSGDTRGTDWYATLSCVGIDDTSQLPLDEAR